MLSEVRNDPETISQRKAYEIFGRRNVERWRRQGKIEPCKRPGKVEYRTADLTTRHRLRSHSDTILSAFSLWDSTTTPTIIVKNSKVKLSGSRSSFIFGQ